LDGFHDGSIQLFSVTGNPALILPVFAHLC
jgi:hypothetical protein